MELLTMRDSMKMIDKLVIGFIIIIMERKKKKDFIEMGLELVSGLFFMKPEIGKIGLANLVSYIIRMVN